MDYRSRSDNRGDGGGFRPRGGFNGDRNGGYREEGYRGGRGGRGGGDRFGDRGGFRGRGGGRGGGGGRGPPLANNPINVEFPIETNFFEIDLSKAQTACKHLVEISNQTTEIEYPKEELREKLVIMYLEHHGRTDLFVGGRVPYDGDRCVILKQQVTLPTTTLRLGRFEYDVALTHQSDHDLREAHQGARAQDDSAQIADIIVQAGARLTQEKQGRAVFVPRIPNDNQLRPVPRQKGIHFWMGHMQSVQSVKTVDLIAPDGPHWGANGNPYQRLHHLQIGAVIAPRSLLCIKRQPLAKYLLDKEDCNLFSRRTDERLCRKINRELKNLKVETNYIRGPDGMPSKRSQKLVQICWDKSPRTEEFKRNEEMVTIQNFYREVYNIDLEYPDGPLVQVGQKMKNTFIPAELVFISQQKIDGNDNPQLKLELAENGCMDPFDRKEYIQKKVEELFPGGNELLDEFGISVSTRMAQWRAERIDTPLVQHRQQRGDGFESFRPDRGAWNMRGRAFIDGKTVDRVRVIDTTGNYVNDRGDPSPDMKSFVQELGNQLGNVRMSGNIQVRWHYVAVDKLDRFRKECLQAENIGDMVFVILPKKDTHIYKVVKSVFDDLCPTQCLVASNTPGLARGKDLYKGAGHLCNILAKVNQKRAGFNHRLDLAAESALGVVAGNTPQERSDMMIVGVNISHPQSSDLNSRYAPSICSVVCSANDSFTLWAHSFRVQTRGNELITDLSEMFEDAVKKRCGVQRNNGWPKRIVYFRDGVSEGKMEDVILQEVANIQNVYHTGGHESPKITVIAAIRHHSIRFWDVNGGNASANLDPGSVVLDRGVHQGQYPNFYLLSHAGIKGMSRPVRYFVLKDEIGLALAKMGKVGSDVLKFWARFVYEQCYNYQRCQRAVAVPAAIYYADQLAQRGRIVASRLLDQFLGVDLYPANHSDTASMSSGNSGHPLKAIAEDARTDALRKTNQFMREFTQRNMPMFYC